jgi:hypothetical protein
LGGRLERRVERAIDSLNEEGYWPSQLWFTSHPYEGAAVPAVVEGDFASTFVGDKSDTSPYRNPERLPCVAVSTFIQNMNVLIGCLEQNP